MDRETNSPQSPRRNRLLFPGAAESHASESSHATSHFPANQDAPIMEVGSAQPIARASSVPARAETVASPAASKLSATRYCTPNLKFASPPSRSPGTQQGEGNNGVYLATTDFSIPVFGITIAAVLNIWLDSWVCQLIAAFMMFALSIILFIKKSFIAAALFVLGAIVVFMIAIPRA